VPGHHIAAIDRTVWPHNHGTFTDDNGNDIQYTRISKDTRSLRPVVVKWDIQVSMEQEYSLRNRVYWNFYGTVGNLQIDKGNVFDSGDEMQDLPIYAFWVNHSDEDPDWAPPGWRFVNSQTLKIWKSHRETTKKLYALLRRKHKFPEHQDRIQALKDEAAQQQEDLRLRFEVGRHGIEQRLQAFGNRSKAKILDVPLGIQPPKFRRAQIINCRWVDVFMLKQDASVSAGTHIPPSWNHRIRCDAEFVCRFQMLRHVIVEHLNVPQDELGTRLANGAWMHGRLSDLWRKNCIDVQNTECKWKECHYRGHQLETDPRKARENLVMHIFNDIQEPLVRRELRGPLLGSAPVICHCDKCIRFTANGFVDLPALGSDSNTPALTPDSGTASPDTLRGDSMDRPNDAGSNSATARAQQEVDEDATEDEDDVPVLTQPASQQPRKRGRPRGSTAAATAAQGATGRKAPDQKAVGQDAAGQKAAGQQAAGPMATDSNATGPKAAGQEAAGPKAPRPRAGGPKAGSKRAACPATLACEAAEADRRAEFQKQVAYYQKQFDDAKAQANQGQGQGTAAQQSTQNQQPAEADAQAQQGQGAASQPPSSN
jgi:hypothetical protein